MTTEDFFSSLTTGKISTKNKLNLDHYPSEL